MSDPRYSQIIDDIFDMRVDEFMEALADELHFDSSARVQLLTSLIEALAAARHGGPTQ